MRYRRKTGVQNTSDASLYTFEREDEVFELKSWFSQRVTRCEGAVATALELLCVLDDNPARGRTEVTVPGKWELPKTTHFANEEIRQSGGAW